MQLYSELYSSYYNIIHSLLSHTEPFTRDTIDAAIRQEGFGETSLYMIPKFASREWTFLEKEGELYISSLNEQPVFVLSLLQKRWLKAILADRRIRLFLDDSQLTALNQVLSDVEPLFHPDDFYIYDRFTDGDHYDDEDYRRIFRIILTAVKNRQYLNISFQSHRNNRIHYWYLPVKLEYSVKNDRFRLLALESRGHSHYEYHTINLSRIEEITETGKYADETSIPDIDEYITKDYHDEPVTLLIRDERNALERAMLQFANYKKNTTRIDENTYRCEIYVGKSNETELLIEVLSFGPAIRVIGNTHFLDLLKKRLNRQRELFT